MFRCQLSASFVLLLAGSLCAAPPAKLDVSLEKDNDGKQFLIAVSGLDPAVLKVCAGRPHDSRDWDKGAHVQLGGGSAEEIAQRPTLMGAWRVRDGKLFFEPRFPFLAATPLQVSVDPLSLADPNSVERHPVVFKLQIPKRDLTPTTKIEAVFPTRKTLPENQLRIYIHFSKPMSRGEAYEHIKLLDANGKTLDDVFLELGEELWDPSMTRFTLLFHPGRVKSGLKPREEFGPILEKGKKYALVISGQWHDAEGRPLIDKEYRKDFTAGPPDDEPIDPKQWKLIPPTGGTKDAFQVRFPESLDHALLQRVVWIVDEQGKKIAGNVTIAEEETLWKFTPEQAWQLGKYRLVADTILEDLAANRIGRAFEVDVFRPVTKEVETKTVELGFEIEQPKLRR